MLEDENDKYVRTSKGWPLKNKDMLKQEKGKQVRTYDDVVSAGGLRNKKKKLVFEVKLRDVTLK